MTVDPRPPVLQRVAAAAAYFWLLMVTYYILKPVRDSLFLGDRGVRELPVAHLLNLAATLVFVQTYVALGRRLTRRSFVLVVNLVLLGVVLAFWAALGPLAVGPAVRKQLAWAFFVFVSAFSVFGVTMLWSMNHTIFSPGEGRRYYGWIGSGGTFGAFCGGYLTRTFARGLGTEQLLLVAAGCFVPSLALGWWIGREADDAEAAARPGPGPAGSTGTDAGSVGERGEDPGAAGKKGADAGAAESSGAARPPARSAVTLIRANPYLAALAGMVFLKLVVALTKDYQLQEVIAAGFRGDTDGRTAFFGGVYQYTNLLGLFLGLVVTGPVQARWGALPGLMTYPLAALGTGVGLLISPTLPAVFWMAVVSQACAYSIFQWSQELLYQRTSKEEKFVAKGFIDTFIFRVGTGVAALTILLAGRLGDAGVAEASRLVMGFLFVAGTALLLVCVRLGVWFDRATAPPQDQPEPEER